MAFTDMCTAHINAMREMCVRQKIQTEIYDTTQSGMVIVASININRGH